MWSLIKFAIWLVGLTVVSYFVLGYFGYEPNRNYFEERKEECQKRLSNCQSELIRKGTEGADCDFNCVDPKLIIKKK